MNIIIPKEKILQFLKGSDLLAEAPAKNYKISGNRGELMKHGHLQAFLKMLEAVSERMRLRSSMLMEWYEEACSQTGLSEGFRKPTIEERQAMGARSILAKQLDVLLTAIDQAVHHETPVPLTIENLRKICTLIFLYSALDPFQNDRGRTLRLLMNYMFLTLGWSFLVFNESEEMKLKAAFQSADTLTIYLAEKLKDHYVSRMGAVVEQERRELHSSLYVLPEGESQVVEWHYFDRDLEILIAA